MIKWVVATLIMVLPILIGADELCPNCPGEMQIKQMLGPLYHQIYSHVFSDAERRLVASYISRGMHPYEAVNVLLRAEQRKYFRELYKPRAKGNKKFQSEVLLENNPSRNPNS